jgi:hypothetical protein
LQFRDDGIPGDKEQGNMIVVSYFNHPDNLVSYFTEQAEVICLQTCQEGGRLDVLLKFLNPFRRVSRRYEFVEDTRNEFAYRIRVCWIHEAVGEGVFHDDPIVDYTQRRSK